MGWAFRDLCAHGGLESACIPIPSVMFLFAGFNVSRGEYSLLAVVAVGVAANVVGSWLAYAVGYFGRVDVLEKHGAKLHVKPQHLQRADRWFDRYGEAAVFFLAHAPDHQDVYFTSGRRRAHAFLALHHFYDAGLHPLDSDADRNWLVGLGITGSAGKTNSTTSTTRSRRCIVLGAIFLFFRWRRKRNGPGPGVRRAGRRCRRYADETFLLGLVQAQPSSFPIFLVGSSACCRRRFPLSAR